MTRIITISFALFFLLFPAPMAQAAEATTLPAAAATVPSARFLYPDEAGNRLAKRAGEQLGSKLGAAGGAALGGALGLMIGGPTGGAVGASVGALAGEIVFGFIGAELAAPPRNNPPNRRKR